MPSLLRQMISFGLVGVVNTAIGFGVIALAQVMFGLHPVVSNMLGYIAGLTNSYFMNRAFTFKGSAHSIRAMLRFLLAFGIAYGANVAVLLILIQISPDQVLLWQGLAMVTYTAIFFLVSKLYVFRHQT